MKLDNPPSAENWTRMQYPEVGKTAKGIFGFLRGSPAFTYEAFRRSVRYRIADGIDVETALRINSSFGSPLGRSHNADAIKAFFEYERLNPIEGLPAFDDVIEYYPLSRSSRIPVKPIAVIRDGDRFSPIFVIPWAKWAFDGFQSSLYMTVLERSIFTLTDFEDSNAKILFVPKLGIGQSAKRTVILWERGDIPLLSEAEFADQIRIYHAGREQALEMYKSYQERQS